MVLCPRRRDTRFSINNSGQVAGWSYLADNSTYHAFLYSNGITQDLGTLAGDTESQATAISSNGLVAGNSNYAGESGETHAFLYANGMLEDLGTLGGVGSWATGVNRSGEVVGGAYGSGSLSGAPLPFLYSNGKMVNLNSLLSSSAAALYTVTSAEGINDNGQIAAEGYLDSNPNVSIGLLLTPTSPVPLPAALWLLISGLGGLGVLAHKKRAA